MKAHMPNCEPEQCRCGPDEPAEPTRYFTDISGTMFWKFGPGELPMHCSGPGSGWRESIFDSPEDLEKSIGAVREITELEGEL